MTQRKTEATGTSRWLAVCVGIAIVGCGGGESPTADSSIASDSASQDAARDTTVANDTSATDTAVQNDTAVVSDAANTEAAIDAGLANGSSCTLAAACASGFCVDGVCCQAACDGTCMACSNPKTGRADGICAAITNETDPDSECDGACLTGACREGACARLANGTTCRASAGTCDVAEVCADGVCPSDSVLPNTQVCRAAIHGCDVAESCDGTAVTCPADLFASATSYAPSCGAYNCTGIAATCRTTCATNADCAGRHICVNNVCQLGRRMFVTSTVHSANLGGLAGADTICRARATAAGLSGYFVAWLSSTTVSAASRIQHYSGPYYRMDGTSARTIAYDWTDLTNGLTVAIATDEFGQSTGSTTYAWTGTNIDGTSAAANCSNWTSASGGDSGRTGWTSAGDSRWTSNISNVCSDTIYRLYCIETDPPG